MAFVLKEANKNLIHSNAVGFLKFVFTGIYYILCPMYHEMEILFPGGVISEKPDGNSNQTL